MGCIFPIWVIVTIAVLSCLVIIVALVLHRKWNMIKFYIFIHFNILTNDDGPENLDDMKFDAFVSYRLVRLH